VLTFSILSSLKEGDTILNGLLIIFFSFFLFIFSFLNWTIACIRPITREILVLDSSLALNAVTFRPLSSTIVSSQPVTLSKLSSSNGESMGNLFYILHWLLQQLSKLLSAGILLLYFPKCVASTICTLGYYSRKFLCIELFVFLFFKQQNLQELSSLHYLGVFARWSCWCGWCLLRWKSICFVSSISRGNCTDNFRVQK